MDKNNLCQVLKKFQGLMLKQDFNVLVRFQRIDCCLSYQSPHKFCQSFPRTRGSSKSLLFLQCMIRPGGNVRRGRNW